ncbi:helix-turn-helix domain-containing protein [Luteolibacter pohnpeiensis]
MGDLAKSIANAIESSGYSLADLSKMTGIHRSQLHRFRSGDFKRYSKNLSLLCKTLQIEDKNATIDRDLSLAAHSLWDGTLDGKKKLIRVLESLAEFR